VFTPVKAGPAISGIALAGSDLFWTDVRAGMIHRTRKDGGGDQIFATGLTAPGVVAADDTRVYWAEIAPGQPAGGSIRSLPLAAAPGAAPDTLATIPIFQSVSTLLAVEGTLYWTPFDSVGSTVYHATLFAAPVATLLAGGQGNVVPGLGASYLLISSAGNVYSAYFHDLWTTALGRIPRPGADEILMSLLPVGIGVSGMAVAGSWLVLAGNPGGRTDLYAAPATEPAGAVIIAHGARTGPVVGPAGVTYIDATGALVAFPADQLGYVAFGHPPP
jgi:hypothetical protein